MPPDYWANVWPRRNRDVSKAYAAKSLTIRPLTQHVVVWLEGLPATLFWSQTLAKSGAQRARIAFRPREDPFGHVDVHYGLRLCTPWYVWLDPAVLQGANPLG